jgi:hypothetical protein
MYKDKEVKKNVKNIFLSMCDVKMFLTFISLNMDEDDVSGNQNNCFWPLHSESIAKCNAGEAGILLKMFGKFMILKWKSSRLS